MISLKRKQAFTLIELLVVMAIVLVLMGLAASSFQSLGRTTDITNSIQSVANTLNMARQIAVSGNEYTQVQLFGPKPSDGDFRNAHFTSMAVYRSDAPYYSNNYTPLLDSGKMRREGPIIKLPQSCIVVNDNTYSPLIQTLSADPKHQLNLSDGSTGVAFYFKPDGSLDVPATVGGTPTVNVLSICSMQGYISEGNKLPANYGIVNINRVNGRFQVIRP